MSTHYYLQFIGSFAELRAAQARAAAATRPKPAPGLPKQPCVTKLTPRPAHLSARLGIDAAGRLRYQLESGQSYCVTGPRPYTGFALDLSTHAPSTMPYPVHKHEEYADAFGEPAPPLSHNEPAEGEEYATASPVRLGEVLAAVALGLAVLVGLLLRRF